MSERSSIPAGYQRLSGQTYIRRGDKTPDSESGWRAVKPHEIAWLWYAPHFLSNVFIRRASRPKRAA